MKTISAYIAGLKQYMHEAVDEQYTRVPVSMEMFLAKACIPF